MALLEKKTIELASGVLVDFDPARDDVNLRMKDSKGNESSVRIPKSELYGVLFMIADPQQQDDLLPIRHTEVQEFVKVHQVRAKKDIKKDDVIRVRCRINVPVTVVEGLKGIVKQEAKRQRIGGGIPLIGI